ncbi:MAG: hypothetical protein ACI9SF_000613 [Candidatus Nanohaloarchaea archaeon]
MLLLVIQFLLIFLPILISVHLVRLSKEEDFNLDREESISKEISNNSLTLAGLTLTSISILFTVEDFSNYVQPMRFFGLAFAMFSLSYFLTYFAGLGSKYRILQDKFHQFGFFTLVIGGVYLLVEKSIIAGFFLYIALATIGILLVFQYSLELQSY